MKKRKLRFSVDDTINNFLGKPTRVVAVALLLIIVLFPLYWLVSNSFKMESEYLKSPPVMVPSRVTMENYIHIFKNVGAGRSLFNTVCVAVFTTVCCVFFGSLAGYALARYNFPCKSPVFGLVIFTLIVPPQLTMISSYIYFQQRSLNVLLMHR